MIFRDKTRNAFFGEQEGIKECNVALFISSDDLEPETISAELGPASYSFRRGDTYVSKAGSLVRAYGFGTWRLETKGFDSKSVEEHAGYLLSLLAGKEEKLQEILNSKLYRVSVVFWWHNNREPGGFNISSDTMTKLCSISQDIEFHFL